MRLTWNPQFRVVQPEQPLREFQVHKPAGTFRIFVIGESPAAAVPYGTALSFAGWLAQRLTAQAPGVHWEVVNAAVGGLQSWSALTPDLRFRENITRGFACTAAGRPGCAR
jgi:hypothetical protein